MLDQGFYLVDQGSLTFHVVGLKHAELGVRAPTISFVSSNGGEGLVLPG